MSESPAQILIIDDDSDLVEAMRITLGSSNYDVIVVYDPEEGMQKAIEEKPDMIILDVMFGSKGESGGFQFAEKLRRDKSLARIPILMSTAINKTYPMLQFSPETDGGYLLVDDFINKPVQPEDLIKRVERLLKMKTSKWANRY